MMISFFQVFFPCVPFSYTSTQVAVSAAAAAAAAMTDFLACLLAAHRHTHTTGRQSYQFEEVVPHGLRRDRHTSTC